MCSLWVQLSNPRQFSNPRELRLLASLIRLNVDFHNVDD
jgi:hypothetical protein